MENVNSEKHSKINYEKRANKKHNLHLIIGALVILACYVFFFNSKAIFNEAAEVQLTQIGEIINFSQDCVLALDEWIYSPSQSRMEVAVNYESTSNMDLKEVEYTSRCNFEKSSKEIVSCPVELKYINANTFVVEISEVPEDFLNIALNIVGKSKDFSAETTEQENSSEDGSEGTEYTASIYMTKEAVEKVQNIPDSKTETDYQIEKIKRSVNSYEKEIEENLKQINLLNNEITSNENKIRELQDAEIYQTTTEIEETEKKIDTINQDIEKLNDEISEIEKTVEEKQNEINRYENLLNTLQNGKTN